MAATISPWQQRLYRLFVAVFVLGVIGSATAVWANVRIRESDAWAETVGPLAENQDIRDLVVERASAVIADRLALDEDAGRLQTYSQNQLIELTNVLLQEFVNSSAFPGWWSTANLEAHRTLVDLANGNEGNIARLDGDSVVLNLQPVIDWINGKLQENLPGLSYQLSTPEDGAYITLYKTEGIEQVIRITQIVDTLAFVLPAVILVALAGAVIVGRDRLAAIGQIALTSAISTGLTMAGLHLLLRRLVSQQPESDRDAIAAFWRVVLTDLSLALRMLALGGIVIAIIIAVVRSRMGGDPRSALIPATSSGMAAGVIITAALLCLALIPEPAVWILIVAILAIIVGCTLLLLARSQSVTSTTAQSSATPGR